MDIFHLLKKFYRNTKMSKSKRTINEKEYQQILKEVFNISLNKYPDKILERG